MEPIPIVLKEELMGFGRLEMEVGYSSMGVAPCGFTAGRFRHHIARVCVLGDGVAALHKVSFGMMMMMTMMVCKKRTLCLELTFCLSGLSYSMA